MRLGECVYLYIWSGNPLHVLFAYHFGRQQVIKILLYCRHFIIYNAVYVNIRRWTGPFCILNSATIDSTTDASYLAYTERCLSYLRYWYSPLDLYVSRWSHNFQIFHVKGILRKKKKEKVFLIHSRIRFVKLHYFCNFTMCSRSG